MKQKEKQYAMNGYTGEVLKFKECKAGGYKVVQKFPNLWAFLDIDKLI